MDEEESNITACNWVLRRRGLAVRAKRSLEGVLARAKAVSFAVKGSATEQHRQRSRFGFTLSARRSTSHAEEDAKPATLGNKSAALANGVSGPSRSTTDCCTRKRCKCAIPA